MIAVMRRALLLALVLFPCAGRAEEGSPLGLWRTPDRGGLIEVTRCGGGLCGRIVGGPPDAEAYDVHNQDPSLRARPLKGLFLFQGLAGGPPAWKGAVYNPSDGGTYDATLTMPAADRLRLRGCTVWPLCRAQVWTRAAGTGER